MTIRPALLMFPLIVGALAAAALPCQAAAQSRYHAEPVIDPREAAAWLSEQASAEHRAVALLLGFAPRPEALSEPADPAPLVRQEQIQSILEASNSPAVLTMLARVCRLSDRIEACRSIGLDQAIVDHDRGNVLARAIFLGDDVGDWQAAVEGHPFASDRSMEIARLVYLALNDFAAADPVDYAPAIVSMQAITQSSALTSAAYSPLVDACAAAQAVTLRACRQLARSMIRDHSSLMDRTIGAALMRTIADAQQAADDSKAWEKASTELREYAACLTLDIDQSFYFGLDARDYRDWFDLAARQGELAGHERWADRRNVDCSAARRALETARTEVGF
jgi:hypothetical protein